MINLEEGRNCWRRTKVDRIRFLLSGQEYFNQLRSAMLRAERSVTILAWDLSERIEMVRCGEDEDGYPSRTADFMFALLDEKPELRINILLWDYSLVYIAEREWLPFTQWRREGNPRLNLVVDDSLQVGASHHQKVVVIDERLAFCGGFDLSAWRWDSAGHQPDDHRRRDPSGKLYQPLHDIQVMLEGAAVDDLVELCSMRWERATGKPLDRMEKKPGGRYWPEGLEPDFENRAAALALTFSRYREYPDVRQIEQLYLDMIRAAREYIYIENQYLSSHLLVSALAERLREEDGPEVVMVLTRDTGGWIEEGTMGLLRERLLGILHENDLHGRFAAYYPHVDDGSGNESQVYVHSKLMITDDRLVRVGSANLSNRSMKVDSELDILILSEKSSPEARWLLCRLLGIHYQAEPDEIKAVLSGSGTFREILDEFGNGRLHRLKPLNGKKLTGVLRKLADTQILDPDEPISPVYRIQDAVEHIDERGLVRRWTPIILKAGAAMLVLMGMAYLFNALWGDFITRENAIQYIESIRGNRAALPVLLVTFMVAGMVAIPINLLLVAGTLVMGPVLTFICGLSGSLASAAIVFAVGHHAGKPLVRKIAPGKLKKLSKLAGNRGVLSVAMLRVLPVAPFPVINLAIGASGLKFRTFMTGSVIGMIPGMLGVVLVTHQFEEAILDPGPVSLALLGMAVLVVTGILLYIRRNVKK